MLSVLGGSSLVRAAEVQWICTTADAPWTEKPAPQVVDAPAGETEIALHPQKAMQTIEGFGGCFNELGWKALSGLSPTARKEVIASLFSDAGCAFTLARTPIGASDFALDYYSLDDHPGDFAMEKFSIERDRGCLIPYIKAAMDERPKLRVWASAWSPPAWMKDAGKYNGGRLKDDPAILKAYALYLSKFAEEYRKEGIDLYAVHVQNEPRIANNYPTCLWSGAAMRDFVRNYMGPTFEARKPGADIWLGTINDGNFNATIGTVMADAKAASYIKGIAFQWDGQNIIADAHALYPNMPLIQSENECHGGKNSFADAEHTFWLFRKYMDGGANAYFFWNMVLQPGGKSSWGWAQNAMITVDSEKGEVTYHPEFYLMKHIAHFIPAGSQLIYSTGVWGDKIGFIRADGSTVLIMGNSASRDYDISIAVPGQSNRVIRVTVPSHSFNTFVFPAAPK